MKFDHARALLSLGRAQRRVKQWGAAREALEGAVAAFDALGSEGWAQQARADLSRVGGRKPRATGELTPTEREVVELAAGGMANKEIAAGLEAGRAHGRGPPLACLCKARREVPRAARRAACRGAVRESLGAVAGSEPKLSQIVRFP